MWCQKPYFIALVGGKGKLRHGNWQSALQEHMVGFISPEVTATPLGRFNFSSYVFSSYFSSVTLFSITFSGGIVFVLATQTSSEDSGSKKISFRPENAIKTGYFRLKQIFAVYLGDCLRWFCGILSARVSYNSQWRSICGVADLFYLQHHFWAEIAY